MNNNKFMLIWCLVLGSLVSCGKQENDPAPASAAEQDYQPTTAGSTWAYGGISPYTAAATGVTKVINGKTYYEMETKQGSTVYKSYLIKENGVYTAIGMVTSMGNLEITILKEGAAVGESWEQTATINGADMKITYTIQEKDISKTVEGKLYKNVINVKMVSSIFFMGQDMGVDITTNYYFAKGIGLILTDLGPSGQVPLLTYDVK